MYLSRRYEAASSGEQSPGWGPPQITVGVTGFGLALGLMALIYFRERVLWAARHQLALWQEVYSQAARVNAELQDDNDLFREGLRYYMGREKEEVSRPEPPGGFQSLDTPGYDPRFVVGSEDECDLVDVPPEGEPVVVRKRDTRIHAYWAPRPVQPGEVKVVDLAARQPKQAGMSTGQPARTTTSEEPKQKPVIRATQRDESPPDLRHQRSLAEELRDAGYFGSGSKSDSDQKSPTATA